MFRNKIHMKQSTYDKFFDGWDIRAAIAKRVSYFLFLSTVRWFVWSTLAYLIYILVQYNLDWAYLGLVDPGNSPNNIIFYATLNTFFTSMYYIVPTAIFYICSLYLQCFESYRKAFSPKDRDPKFGRPRLRDFWLFFGTRVFIDTTRADGYNNHDYRVVLNKIKEWADSNCKSLWVFTASDPNQSELLESFAKKNKIKTHYVSNIYTIFFLSKKDALLFKLKMSDKEFEIFMID